MRDDWDLPRLNAWSDYCGEHPTLRSMVQSYLGIDTKPKVAGTAPELLELLAVFPGAQQIVS